MSNRSSIYTLLLISPLAWVGLLLFTHFVPPRTFLAFIVFFLILSVALTSTSSPLAYMLGSRLLSPRIYRATIRHAIRQGALFSLVIVLNLVLRALNSWSVFTAIAVIGAAVVVEILSLAKK